MLFSKILLHSGFQSSVKAFYYTRFFITYLDFGLQPKRDKSNNLNITSGGESDYFS